MPLGAVAVLLLREGLEHGRRVAAGAAVGIAAADAIFATLAVIFGPVIGGLVAGYQRQIQLLAAAVLAVVAVVGVARTLRDRRQEFESVAADVGSARTTGAAFVRFLVITLANPLTVVYFAVVATGVASVLRGTGQGVAFIVGVLLGSGGWQLTLAMASS